jgi:hypothetical protein
MKKITEVLLAMMLAAVAVSCGEKVDPTPVGPGKDPDKDPLANCVLPASVKAGGEVQVQWDGFKDDAAISLVGEDSASEMMQVKIVTAYGLTFGVPIDFPTGVYTVVLKQQGETMELGSIKVDAPDMPVTGLKVPAGAVRGEVVSIDGIGFKDGCKVIAVDQEGAEFELPAELSVSGISVTIPETLAEGDYQLYLIQDGLRWLLSSSFSVVAEVVVKTLERVDYYTSYDDERLLRLTWEISREEPVTLTLSQFIVTGDEAVLDIYDQYVLGSDGFFELVVDGFEESNNMKMSYTRDDEGKVILADVLRYGKKETTPFTWTYDQDGFLTDVSSPVASLSSFEYEAGNMVTFRNTAFEFGDPSLVNNPSAPDVIWAYMALMDNKEPFMYVPYFLGWYTKASAQLPTAMLEPSNTGTGTDTYPITYEFDSDGYVVKMYLGSDKVEYFYGE